MKSGVRKLVVNADDFGFTRDVNQGIVEAHRDGILTAATLMAAGGSDDAAFDDAVRLGAAKRPRSISAVTWSSWGSRLFPPQWRN